MVKKKVKIFAASALTLALLAGCSNDGKGSDPSASAQATPAATPNEPVTLRMLIWDVTIPDESFKSWIADPVKEKYPYITMELIRPTAGQKLDQVIQSGDFPDMIYEGARTINQFITSKIAEDLTPYAKNNKMDLNKFEPNLLNALKSYGDNGQLYAMPFNSFFWALFYNKDLLDKFNVPYPKDGVSWEELLQVVPRLAKTDGGVQYYGVRAPHNVEVFGAPFAFKIYDEKTGKAMLNTDGWKKVFTLYKQFKTYPGNDIGDKFTNDDFTKKQNTAMVADNGNAILEKIVAADKEGTHMNWDMVKYPRFDGNPDRALEVNGHVLLMSSTGKHKDDVFKVMSLLTDQGVQLKMTKETRLTALVDPEIHKHYGESLPIFKGKNLSALSQPPAPAADHSKYPELVRSFIRPAANMTTKFMLDGADVVEALREAEEKAQKAVDDAKAGK